MPTAIDFSFARPTPQQIVDAGASGILVYTGAARPDADYLTAIRDRGLTVCLVQESSPNRAQAGQSAGVFDAQYADRRADEVGYPITASICYVVSDGNAGDPSSGGDQIAAYANGIAQTSRRRFFFYGNTYATQAALSGAPTALGTWVPSTWGPATLLTQEANTPSPVPDSDLNTVHAPYGAWGSTAPEPDPLPLEDEDMMLVYGPVFGRLGNVAHLVAGSLILDEWSEDNGGGTLGIPNKLYAWNKKPGHGYTAKALDTPQMKKLREANHL